MTKTILFLILDKWSDWEAAYLAPAITMFGEGKYQVKAVALNLEPVMSIGKFKTLPDYSISSIPEEYEALILVGGMSWRNDTYPQIQKLVKQTIEQKKILGAICDAAGYLASIGVLNNVKHTGNDLLDINKWAQPNYTGADKFLHEMAVQDNNIVTANGTAPLEFAKEVLLALNIVPQEHIEEWYLFSKLGSYTKKLVF